MMKLIFTEPTLGAVTRARTLVSATCVAGGIACSAGLSIPGMRLTT